MARPLRFVLRLVLGLGLGISGCGGRPATVGDGLTSTKHDAATSTPDQSPRIEWDVPGDLFPWRDARVPVPDLAQPDQGPCPVCKKGEGYLLPNCAAVDKEGTCATLCDPADPQACPSGHVCVQWAATPCCFCSAAVSACVPKAPIVGPLYMNPTQGAAGQPVNLTIRGAPFTIGALYYVVRMGKETKAGAHTSSSCALTADFTPNPGIYAVEVSQYGGGGPWVLAGFYTASGGVIGPPTVQPGYPCSMTPAPGDPACASAPPYTCSCVSGRCTCK